MLLLFIAADCRKQSKILYIWALPTAKTMSTDLNCIGFPVTTGRAGSRARYGWLNTRRTDCSFTQHNDKDRSFKVPKCMRTSKCIQWHANKHQHTHKHTHTHSAQRDRWEKTQRSAVSRASLRQDSGSFTSPWLRRWSWPKPIFSTVIALYYTVQVSKCFKGLELWKASSVPNAIQPVLCCSLSWPDCIAHPVL